MELRSKTRLWPLPGGDRRGAPGAGAGCHSLRSVSGSESSRRAPTDKNVTAGPSPSSPPLSSSSSSSSLFPSIPSSKPSYRTRSSSSISQSVQSENVAQEIVSISDTVPTSTRTTTRTRIKWTPEMNQFILRTYLYLTAMGTDTKAYLESLHTKFTEKFPHIQVTRNILGGQRRAIVVDKKYIPQDIVDKIYAEVKAELENIESATQTQQQLMIQTMAPAPGRRMKWSTQLYETLVRGYYTVTRLETNKTAYRQQLHQYFLTAHPHLSNVTEQQVADQRGQVFKNKNLMSQNRLNSIKQQVADELCIGNPEINAEISTQNTIVETPATQQMVELFNNIDTESVSEPEPDHNDSDERNAEVDEVFESALTYFSNTMPTDRPYIPKQRASKKLAQTVEYINKTILPAKINTDTTFETIQTVTYCAAWTASKINGTKLIIPLTQITLTNNTHFRKSKPKWQRRIENKINDLRTKIGRLTQYIRGIRTDKLTNHVDKIIRDYKVHSAYENPNTQLPQFLDTLKQKLTVSSSRLNRYKKCTQRKTQNKEFKYNERKFYRNINSNTTNQTNTARNNNLGPEPEQLKAFWGSIWDNPVTHNAESDWIQKEKNKHINTEPMVYEHIPITVFANVINSLHNWKTPGSDHIHNYWYKKFTYLHPYIYNNLNHFIQNPCDMPHYFTVGTTYMLPKDLDDPLNPAKYRPITCLQSIYKILTACLANLIYSHVENNNILVEQQKGCRKFSRGCKEQITIDAVILNQVQRNKKDLYSMYIDYKKAFDSVPHTWLIEILNIYKIHPKLISFLETAIDNWNTKLNLRTSNESLTTEPIKIRRGIFQGDTLSPLWFCLALNPLSNLLNSTDTGYELIYKDTDTETWTEQTRTFKLNHLLYMDDIKLYASTQNQLDDLVQVTESFSKDINMEFGIDKCKINSVKAGQVIQHSYNLQAGGAIESLTENETYKYLGLNQSRYIHHKEIKQKLTQEFKHRLNTILKSQLNSKNIVKAINTYAIPILTYSFGLIKWSKTEIKNLQRTINVLMTRNRKHHPRACIQRQILPRKEGGRGIIDLANLHNSQIHNMRIFFHNKCLNSDLHLAITQNDKKLTLLNLNDTSTQLNETTIDPKLKIDEWTRKSLHGRHRQDLCQPNVDKDASNEWLVRGELFPETEGFMIAIQDQVIETRNYQKHIIRSTNFPTDLCRRCTSASETIQHITGACKAIVQTDYKHRHDQVANIIHQGLALKYKLISSWTPYYKYTPDTVLENATHKLYFDRAILTDRTVHHNRPDITLLDKIHKTAQLIDIAVPNTHNIQNTIAEKLSKYVDLKNEIARMWNLNKVTIVPIVLSSTGIIPVQLHQSLETLNLPKYLYFTLQKATILNTCRIVRKFLQTDQSQTLEQHHHLI